MKTVLSLIAGATFLLPGQSAVDAAPPEQWVDRQTYVMGTLLRASVAASDRDEAIDAIEEVFINTRRLEAMLSSWTSDSEIGRINSAPVGEAVTVSEELIELLEEAATWTSRTAGAFDPGVGALTDAWDLRGEGRAPGPHLLAEALRSTGIRHFEISGASGTVQRLDEGAWIDTGGFGKGVALRQAERLLRDRGITSGSLDFGGQILVFGAPEDGTAWKVAVADPRARLQKGTELTIGAGSVSTSAQSERFVTVSGKRYGHVIDPRSGLPVPGWGSVTVVGEDPVAADILSTALLVMGPAAGLSWAMHQDAVGVLFLEEQNNGVKASWNTAFETHQPQLTVEK